MLKQEFYRLVKSKTSLIILVLLIISAVSYFFSYSEKLMFLDQLNNDFSADLNREALSNLVASYTGIRFLFDYWFNSDFTQIATIIIYIWGGIFLSSNLFLQKENGWGDFIVTRRKYSFVAKNTLIAQSLYILFIVAVTTILQLLLAMIWGGFDVKHISIGIYELNLLQIILVIILQIIIISSYGILANGISMMCNTLIKNRYIIQALPLLVFGVLPMLLAATLGNLSNLFASIIIYFEPFNVSMTISNVFQSEFDIREIAYNIIPFVVYAAALFLFAFVDIKKNSREYL